MDNPFAQEPEKKDQTAPPTATSAPMEGTGAPVSPPVTSVPVTQPPQTAAPTQTPAPVVTPAPAEEVIEKVETADKDGDEDELLIENDGNVFWLFQKIVWSVFKLALMVGAIGLLAWIIWRPVNNPLKEIHRESEVEEVKKVEDSKSQKVKEKSVTDSVKDIFKKKSDPTDVSDSAKATPDKSLDKELDVGDVITPATALAENYAYKMGLWADWLEDSRQVENEKVMSKSLYWAKRSEGFFDLTVEELLPSPDPTDRAKRIDGTIQVLRGMIDESRWLSLTLNDELNKASVQSRASESSMLEHDRLLADSIEVMDGDRAEFLLAEKSRFYQDFVAQNTKINAYHFVLNRIQITAPLLQELHDNLVANRQVMIDNVHVIGFPRDQFRLILTPAEWKKGQ